MKMLIFLIAIFFPLLSFAVDTYVGPSPLTSVEYNNPANWSGGYVPGSSELIIFNTPVIISGNIPTTTSNAIRVAAPGSLTIGSGVTLNTSDVDIKGASIVNNGIWNAHNISYSVANGSLTNKGTLNGANLNVGTGTLSGSFTNSGNVAMTANIVVEEGTFNNNPGGKITSNGLAIRNGATVDNGGSLTSTATSSSSQMDIDAGGTLINEPTGVLVSKMTVGNVYAMNINGTFTNKGIMDVGVSPINLGSQGVKAGNGANFQNTGSMIFSIDPGNCVLTNNVGVTGTFSPGVIAIYSGLNCLNTPTGLPLAITLKDFSVKMQDCNAVLYWSTAEESGCAHIDLQWSEDGTGFKTVGTVQAKGTGSNYQLTYQQNNSATNYYRLQIVNNDGSKEYSTILMVKGCAGSTGTSVVSCYPSPVSETLMIQGANDSSNIRIYDVFGKLILIKTISGSIEKIDVSEFHPGLYFLWVTDKQTGLSTVFKIMKQ